MEQYLSKIKRISRWGLIVSLVVVACTLVWVWFSPYTWRQSDRVHAWMMMVGCVLAIADMAMVLLMVRREIPKIRQQEGVEPRLVRYVGVVHRIYATTTIVVTALCVFVVLTGDRNMLMLVMLLALTLFMAFPNIYRMKVDLGLTDEEASVLWGEEYLLPREDEAPADEGDSK